MNNIFFFYVVIFKNMRGSNITLPKTTFDIGMLQLAAVAEQAVLPPGAKYIDGRPYWCSRNTFARDIAAPVKVSPPSPPFAPPLIS